MPIWLVDMLSGSPWAAVGVLGFCLYKVICKILDSSVPLVRLLTVLGTKRMRRDARETLRLEGRAEDRPSLPEQ